MNSENIRMKHRLLLVCQGPLLERRAKAYPNIWRGPSDLVWWSISDDWFIWFTWSDSHVFHRLQLPSAPVMWAKSDDRISQQCQAKASFPDYVLAEIQRANFKEPTFFSSIISSDHSKISACSKVEYSKSRAQDCIAGVWCFMKPKRFSKI